MILANHSRRFLFGFTLLEVMLSVVLTMLVVGAVMSIVSTSVGASVWMEKEELRIRQVESVLDYFESSLWETATERGLAIWSIDGVQGKPWRDQLFWTTPDGDSGFLQDEARSCEVVAGIREEGGVPWLGIAARASEDRNGEYSWIPMLEDVDSLNLEFFDKRLNSFVDQWPQGNAIPGMIRITVRFGSDGISRTRILRFPELQESAGGGLGNTGRRRPGQDNEPGGNNPSVEVPPPGGGEGGVPPQRGGGPGSGNRPPNTGGRERP